MSEEKQVKQQLRKNMFLNLITFSIIFTILGVIIYGQFANSLYKSADEELNRSVNQANMKLDKFSNEQKNNEKQPGDYKQKNQVDFRNAEPPQDDERPGTMAVEEKKKETVDSPRVIKITRYSDGTISYINSINDSINEMFENAQFDKNLLETIYETTLERIFI